MTKRELEKLTSPFAIDLSRLSSLPARPSPARSASVLTMTMRGRTKIMVGPQRSRDAREGAISIRLVNVMVDVGGEESAKGERKGSVRESSFRYVTFQRLLAWIPEPRQNIQAKVIM
jgi:hypothetical protein